MGANPGDLEVDVARQEVGLRGERLELTPTEYKLLYHLVRSAGHILRHGTLLAKVGGREYVDEVDYIGSTSAGFARSSATTPITRGTGGRTRAGLPIRGR